MWIKVEGNITIKKLKKETFAYLLFIQVLFLYVFLCFFCFVFLFFHKD